MRKYQGGGGCVEKHGGKWRGKLRYQDSDGWHMLHKTFDLKAYPNSNRGRAAALTAWREWRAELVAAEPERARREAARAEAARRGLVTDESTVADLLDWYTDRHLPVHGSRKSHKPLQASTLDDYRWRASVIKRTALASVQLCDLTRHTLQAWADDMMARYDSPTSVKDIAIVLTSALAEACDQEIIGKNPAARLAIPMAPKTEPSTLTPDQRAALLADVDATLAGSNARGDASSRELLSQSTGGALGIKLACLTGMRQGEVCGLQWGDVDLDARVITVRHAIGKAKGGYYLKPPKSGAGVRAIPIADDGLLADLAARRDQMAAQAAAAGADLPPAAYVCGGADGAWLTPLALYKAFKRRCARLGIVDADGKTPAFHDLRHTFATVMAHAGVPAATLKTLMGHESIDTTMTYYVGVDDEASRRAMELTNRALKGGSARVIPYGAIANGTEG